MSSAVGIMQARVTRDRLAADPPDLVLKPDLSSLQLMDFHRARESIDTGRKSVEAAETDLARLAERLVVKRDGRTGTTRVASKTGAKP
jgi:predicted acylesterase/phospholipase RssA